ncbi:MAG: zinc-dependent metalloprotease, partial [Blastocatellia bacterium]
NLARAWYFVQAGPLDPRAQRLPLPDDLMGELIRYVAAHEVGHTLGFQHNMKASSQYSIEQIRDRDFVKKMSHTPTLMDYSRFNYVAQPEDRLAVEDLIPKIGPYDKWATMWGYKPIGEVKSPEEERATLDQWAREQDRTPHLRFSTARSRGSDPGENTEAVGDADAVKATELGLKNLKRVADMLLTATSTSTGEPYDDLEEIFGRMLGQWRLEMGHVTQIVGGFNSQQKHIGQEGVLFTAVPREKQVAAVRFLNENAFATPTWMIKPEILRRIETDGTINRIRTTQQALLSQLLSSARFARLIEQEEIDRGTYRAVDLLVDVRKGIWSEIGGRGTVRIDAFRRNLQRAYLDLMNDKLNPGDGRPATIHPWGAEDPGRRPVGGNSSNDRSLGTTSSRRCTRYDREDTRSEVHGTSSRSNRYRQPSGTWSRVRVRARSALPRPALLPAILWMEPCLLAGDGDYD